MVIGESVVAMFMGVNDFGDLRRDRPVMALPG
jgi:hypothetical protein